MIKKIPFDGSVQDADLAFERFISEYYDSLEFKPLNIRLELRQLSADMQYRLCMMVIRGNVVNSEMTILARYTPKGTILEMDTTYDGAWYELAGAWERVKDFLIDEGWITAKSGNGAKYGKAGRKPDQLYEDAAKMIRGGASKNQARDWFFQKSGIPRDPDSEKAYDEAIRRRLKPTK